MQFVAAAGEAHAHFRHGVGGGGADGQTGELRGGLAGLGEDGEGEKGGEAMRANAGTLRLPAQRVAPGFQLGQGDACRGMHGAPR